MIIETIVYNFKDLNVIKKACFVLCGTQKIALF